MMAGVTSCIEDGVTTSPSAQPEFSVDTLDMGMVFTQQGTPTYSFTVRNRHDKILNISEIALRDGGKGVFRLNVDGMSGKSFSNVEIRPNDSIYVFVEATVPEVGAPLASEILDCLDFVTNGVTRSVYLRAEGQDVRRMRGVVIDTDTRLDADYPYQIFDSLVVSEGATLTLDPGVALHFHDKSILKVKGRLVSDGTPERPVNMTGDRTDNVVGSIPFDLMASQWYGVVFEPTAGGSRLTSTVIRNTVAGVTVDSVAAPDSRTPGVKFVNCRLRNSAGRALNAFHSDVEAVGCEIADASQGVAYLHGGNVRFNFCTFANYYLFTALGGPAIALDHIAYDNDDGSGLPYMQADFTNCIIYGNGADLSHGDLTGTDVYFRNCLFKSSGSDDDNFISCLWDTDPLYFTVREDYIFDYRLREGSPAAEAADPTLTLDGWATDFYGIPRRLSLGAYQATAQ